MNKNIKPYIIFIFLVSFMFVPIYSQSSKPRTQSSKVTKNDSPSRSKTVTIKSTNSQRTHRINKQWEKNTTLGMYSNFPSKTNKHSKQNCFSKLSQHAQRRFLLQLARTKHLRWWQT